METTSNQETWCSPRWRASLTGLLGWEHTHKEAHTYVVIYFSAVNSSLYTCVWTLRSVNQRADTRSESRSSSLGPIRCMYIHNSDVSSPDKPSTALTELWSISPPSSEVTSFQGTSSRTSGIRWSTAAAFASKASLRACGRSRTRRESGVNLKSESENLKENARQ